MLYNPGLPAWIFGMDSGLKFLFALITFFVSYYALKVHKISGKKPPLLLSRGFLLISISYIIQSIFQLIIATRIIYPVCRIFGIPDVLILNRIGIAIQISFYLLGVVTITYMTLHVESRRIFTLLTLLTLLALFFSFSAMFSFYAISAALFGFIVYYYLEREKGKHKTTLILAAFIFLFLSSVTYIFMGYNYVFMVVSPLLELFAYLLILLNLIMVIR
ncbi:MAG: hypothetical protein ACMXYK_05035 [Candidatus Woesearchaeota archaeon]